MGAHFFPRAGYAMIVGAALVMPTTGFAFEATDNPVADAFLASLEAGGAQNAAIEDVAVSGDQIVLRGLSADYPKNGDKGSLSAASIAFSDASVAPDGSIKASAVAITDMNMVQDGDALEFAAAAITDARIPSPEEIRDPASALENDLAYKALEVTGVTFKSEGEADVPVERITSTFEPQGDDGSIKAAFTVEQMQLDPAAIDNKDLRDKLKGLGYESVNINLKGVGEWAVADGQARLETLEISGQEMGTLQLSGTILGATPELVAKLQAAREDMGEMMKLLQTLSISDLKVHFVNDSLVDRILDQQAEAAGTDRDGLVEQLSSALPNMLGLLRNPEFQEKVAAALTAFLKDPGTLTATANPAQPVPMAQVVGTAMIAPQTIPDVLSVDVTANQ